MLKKTVSVIVPIYNASKHLSCCIHSILQQTYTELQIILVNDGSTDDSLDICNRLALEDNRICVLNKENSGVSDTRNVGIENASGYFTMFVDSDDYLRPDCIEQFINAYTEDLDGIFGVHSYNYNGRILKRNVRIPCGTYTYSEIKNKLIDDGTLTGILFGSVCGVLYITEIIKKYKIEFDRIVKKNEDGIFNIKYLTYASKILATDFAGYIYRQDADEKRNILQKESFDISNSAIEHFFSQRDLDYVSSSEYQRQMNARSISIIFWIILSCVESNLTFDEKYKFVKKELKNISKEKYSSLNMQAMTKYKRIIAVTMKNRWALFYVIGIGVFYNRLKSRIKR